MALLEGGIVVVVVASPLVLQELGVLVDVSLLLELLGRLLSRRLIALVALETGILSLLLDSLALVSREALVAVSARLVLGSLLVVGDVGVDFICLVGRFLSDKRENLRGKQTNKERQTSVRPGNLVLELPERFHCPLKGHNLEKETVEEEVRRRRKSRDA